ncbi:tetratricopeptide repeat protein [Rhodobacterales bacterium LSUCC0031]|nr:tetratricopeptide repeat protein [Rhodobacterales bacterium LSUCC0031]
MRRPLLAALPIILGLGFGPVAMAQDVGQGLAGPYLAARAAVLEGNHRIAATYFETALAADPGNPVLIGNAIFANAALGQWMRAATIAAMLPAESGGQELVNLVGMVQGMAAGDLADVRAAIAAGQGAGPLIDDLAMGWIYLGEGDMRRATDAFLSIAADESLSDIAYTHLAYARAAVGDFEGADAILSGDAFGPLSASPRAVRARAEVLMQLDRRKDALELLDFYTNLVPDPAMLALRTQIAAASTLTGYSFITTAQQGVAEVFYGIARILAGENGSGTLPLLYARAAHGIDPAHSEALILAGELLRDAGQFELAADTYVEVGTDDPQFVDAQLGRADAYFEVGREEDAVVVLRDLAAQNPGLATVQAALGDALRRTDRCDEAVVAYTTALNLVDITQTRAWFLYYTRGICHEVLDDFAGSEADFRQALVLNPEQPQVLNNLGYSLVEQRRNLDEALDMIERAVAARPDSGYIVDSLGWVLYRLGRFDEAVEPMERAVALLPTDPIVNDHLGDVYWMVGRKREAQFQWQRALSFDPEEGDATRIRRKLEIGLDRVLEDEGGVGEQR